MWSFLMTEFLALLYGLSEGGGVICATWELWKWWFRISKDCFSDVHRFKVCKFCLMETVNLTSRQRINTWFIVFHQDITVVFWCEVASKNLKLPLSTQGPSVDNPNQKHPETDMEDSPPPGSTLALENVSHYNLQILFCLCGNGCLREIWHVYGPAQNSWSCMVSKSCKINVPTTLEVHFCISTAVFSPGFLNRGVHLDPLEYYV